MDADSPEILERFNGELQLVEIVARQVSRGLGSEVELDELISLGRIGLLEAARRFQPERGVPFRAFANYRVRGAMIDGLRTAARLPRRIHAKVRAYEAATRFNEGSIEDVSAPQPLGTTRADAEQALADHLAGMATAIAAGLVAEAAVGESGELAGVAREPSAQDQMERAELLSALAEAVETLPKEEAELVRRHYFEGERFDHVAEDLGLSKSWASRLHTRALKRLGKRMRGRGVP